MNMLSPTLDQKVRELWIRADGLPDDADYRVKNDLVLAIYGAVGEYFGQPSREGSGLRSLLMKAETNSKNHVERDAASNLLKSVFLRHMIAHPHSDDPPLPLRVRQVRSLAGSLWALVYSVLPPKSALANTQQVDEPSESRDYARAFKQQWGWKSKDTWEIAASAPYDLQVQMDSGTLSFDAVLSELGNALLVRVEDRLIWCDPLTLEKQFECLIEGGNILDFAVASDASHCAVLVGSALSLLNKEGETIWCRDAATGSEVVHDFPFYDEEAGGAVYIANGKIIASLAGEENVTNVFSLSGKILTRLKPEVGYALLSVTRDGKWIMFRYQELVELMDTHRKRPVFKPYTYPDAAEISADGSILVGIDIENWETGATDERVVLRFRRPSGELISEKVLDKAPANVDHPLTYEWYFDPPVLTRDGAYCLIKARREGAQKSQICLFDTATAELLWLNDIDPGLGVAHPFSWSGFYRTQFTGGMKIAPDARLIAVTKPDGFVLYNGEGVVLWESGNLGGRTRIVAITPGGHGIISASYLEEQQQIVLHRWSRV